MLGLSAVSVAVILDVVFIATVFLFACKDASKGFIRCLCGFMITAIAMAAYTFTSFSMAIVNVVKYKKYNSPVFSASKAISFAAACVSMLTLTSTMLTTFSDGTMDVLTQKMMLGSVGIAVSGVVVTMAIYMIAQSTKKLKKINTEVQNGEQ